MKRLLCFLLFVCVIVSASGCKPAAETTAPSAETNADNTTSSVETIPEVVHKQVTMAAVSVPTVTESKYADDGTLLFNYTYQNMVLTLQEPEVADKVIIDFLNRIDSTNQTATSILSSAQSTYTGADSWIPYVCNIAYSPTRIDHGVLSLFGTLITYTGASHPERSCVSASYDLVTGDVLTLASIMSMDATAEDFSQLTVEALKEIADAKYLYQGYEQTVADRFAGDTSMDENWFFSQRGLCFYFAPYEIAPYSSGIITVEIPYEKLTGLLHDGYFPAERTTSAGEVYIVPFDQADMTQYTQIAELTLQREAEKVVLYTDGALQDIRVSVSANEADTDVYTAFASFALTPGDAIVIEATQEQLAKMKLSYLSDGQQTTVPITAE